jgi:K+-transporting ATPase A subunit
MSANGWLQIGVYLLALLALVKPLGWYMARVYEGKPCGLDRALGPVERLFYRLWVSGRNRKWVGKPMPWPCSSSTCSAC